jgi:hypothetical protein
MKKIIFYIMLILLFANCTIQSVALNVNSASKSIEAKKKIYVMNTSYNKYVDKKLDVKIVEALKESGFILVKTPDEAEVFVLVSYGVTEPHTVTFFNDCDGISGGGGAKRKTTYYNYISFTGIDKKELKSDHIRVPVWKTYASFYSSTDRFDTLFPYLLNAVKPYFGQNLAQPITIDEPLGEDKEKK